MMTTRRKSTTKTKTDAEHPWAVRLPADLLARLDALVPMVAGDTTTAVMVGRISRSSVLRLAILEGVKALERRYRE